MKIETSSPGNNTHSTTHSTSQSTSTKFSTFGSTTTGSNYHSTTSKPQNCEVEWDKNNVVATQLEGSWAVNKELTSVLHPIHSFPSIK